MCRAASVKAAVGQCWRPAAGPLPWLSWPVFLPAALPSLPSIPIQTKGWTGTHINRNVAIPGCSLPLCHGPSSTPRQHISPLARHEFRVPLDLLLSTILICSKRSCPLGCWCTPAMQQRGPGCRACIVQHNCRAGAVTLALPCHCLPAVPRALNPQRQCLLSCLCYSSLLAVCFAPCHPNCSTAQRRASGWQQGTLGEGH